MTIKLLQNSVMCSGLLLYMMLLPGCVTSGGISACPPPLIPPEEVMAVFETYPEGSAMAEFYKDYTVQQVQLAVCRGEETPE